LSVLVWTIVRVIVVIGHSPPPEALRWLFLLSALAVLDRSHCSIPLESVAWRACSQKRLFRLHS